MYSEVKVYKIYWTLLVFSSLFLLVTCKNSDNMVSPSDSPPPGTVKVNIEIPSAVKKDNLVVSSDSIEAKIDNNGSYYLPKRSFYAAYNKNINGLTYLSLNSLNQEIQLNAKETAISLAALPLNSIFSLAKSADVSKIKESIYSFNEVKLLESAIKNAVNNKGYFLLSDISLEFENAIKEVFSVIAASTNSSVIKSAGFRKNLNKTNRLTKTSSEILTITPTETVKGIRIVLENTSEISEGKYKGDIKVYNDNLAYFVMKQGKYENNIFVESPYIFRPVIKCSKPSNLINVVLDWDSFLNFVQTPYYLITDPNKADHYTAEKTETKNLDFDNDKNIVQIIGNTDPEVRKLNLINTILSSCSGLVSITGLETNKLVETLLQDPSFANQIGVQIEKNSFDGVVELIFNKLTEYIKTQAINIALGTRLLNELTPYYTYYKTIASLNDIFTSYLASGIRFGNVEFQVNGIRQKSTYTIAGKVVDKKGNGIYAVDIQLQNGKKTQTDVNGNYSFQDIASGLTTIQAIKQNYKFTPPEFVIFINSNTTVSNFVGVESSFISGNVKDESGNAISEVTISAGTSAALTDANGFYSISDLEVGVTVALIPSKTGYTFTKPSESVLVISGGKTNINFIGKQNITTMGIPCPGIPTVTYAGKIYNTVLISSQCWLKENLDVGTMILSNKYSSGNDIIEKYCYNNKIENCEKYGGIYKFGEAMAYTSKAGSKGICPDGWHIPTAEEYRTLGRAVSNNTNALKAIGQGEGNGIGTNTSGFSILFSSHLTGNGTFTDLNSDALFWSSSPTSYGAGGEIFFIFNNNNSLGFGYTNSDELGISVRCIKD